MLKAHLNPAPKPNVTGANPNKMYKRDHTNSHEWGTIN